MRITEPTPTMKPRRLYYPTFMEMLRLAPGTQLFRSFYVEGADGQPVDTLQAGALACANFVSSMLLLNNAIDKRCGTITNTVAEMVDSGWKPVAEQDMTPGDVLVWEVQRHGDGHKHIGFFMGEGRAISNSSELGAIALHDMTYNGTRGIEAVYQYPHWGS